MEIVFKEDREYYCSGCNADATHNPGPVNSEGICQACFDYRRSFLCRGDGCTEEGEERFSFGITAGNWCGPCWDKAPYKKEGAEGFDPDYAGECLEDDY